MTKEPPVPRFWHPHFIEDYQKANPDRKIATLTWSPDEDVVIEQLVGAIESKADVIVSELLPDELPDRVLLKEHEYFGERYVFVPPQFETEINPCVSANKGDSKPLLVFNSNTSQQFAIGNHSKKSSSHVLKVLQTAEIMGAVDLSSTEFAIKDLVKAIEGAAKVVTLLEHPQESLTVRMIAARLQKPCTSLNDDVGSPFRYASSGIVPEITISSSNKSLREIITDAVSENGDKCTTNILGKETLELFTKKYSEGDWMAACNNTDYQWFAKGLYAIEPDKELWREPWISSRNIVSETDRRSILRRMERKVIHSFLQNVPDHIQENQIKNEVYIGLQDKLLSWYIKRFLYKNQVSSWVEEFMNCYIKYNKWIEYTQSEILSWYEEDGKNATMLSEVGEVLLILYAREKDVNTKERLLKKAEELTSLDQRLSRLNTQSGYALHHFVCQKANDKDADLAKEYMQKALSSGNNLAAIKRSLQILPILISPETYSQIISDINSSDLPRINLYVDISKGIENSSGVPVIDLQYDIGFANDNKEVLLKQLDILNRIHNAESRISLTHLSLLFRFESESAIEASINEPEIRRKLVFIWLLWYFQHESESKKLHDTIQPEELATSFQSLYYIYNSILYSEKFHINDLLQKTIESKPNLILETDELSPTENYLLYNIHSFLEMTEKAESQLRIVESLLPSFHSSQRYKSQRLRADSTP